MAGSKSLPTISMEKPNGRVVKVNLSDKSVYEGMGWKICDAVSTPAPKEVFEPTEEQAETKEDVSVEETIAAVKKMTGKELEEFVLINDFNVSLAGKSMAKRRKAIIEHLEGL